LRTSCTSDQGFGSLTFDMTAPAIHDKYVAGFSDIDERIIRHAFTSRTAEKCVSFNETGAISMPTLHELSFRWCRSDTRTFSQTNCERDVDMSVIFSKASALILQSSRRR
jgi:hypothetical protein